MGDTEISWTHQPGTVGKTWNPVQGCRRISAGCEHCYAERLAARFAESGWSQGLINLKTRKWNGEARLAAHKLAEPLRWRQPATVFVNSMSDLFYERFTNEEIAAVFGVMAACPQHTFQILTKRAKRMREWFEWARKVECVIKGMETEAIRSSLHHAACEASADVAKLTAGKWSGFHWPLPNVWLGVSVENQDAADERIPELLATPAAIRFLSCEPLIGPVRFAEPWLLGRFIECPDEEAGEDVDPCDGCPAIPTDGMRGGDYCGAIRGPHLDWVIAGCESGPGARKCDVAWLRSLRDQCGAAGVPYFLKQAVENIGRCGDADNPNGDEPCGERITSYVYGKGHASYSCACCVEGSEDGDSPDLGFGEGSKRKSGGVVELPYLDGVQHCQFPEVKS